jgi:hypothetical protein
MSRGAGSDETPAAQGAGVARRAAAWRWFDRNVLELGREMRLSYLPPLMVYLAAGISGLTGIVGTFFVKEYLGLSAAFLAALGFWAGIPWALKMPIGHAVDLIWRWKGALVFLGAGLIAASLVIMVLLIGRRDAMGTIMPVEAWYVLSVLLAPIGYVVQDAVADAMTVEAVPRVEADGTPVEEERRKLMHTTMQTLGRVAIIGGSVLVALINLYLFAGTENLSQEERAPIYRDVYLMALGIPVISVLGVLLAQALRWRERRQLLAHGFTDAEARSRLTEPAAATAPNWWILCGSLAFVVFTAGVGVARVPYDQEIIFAGSFAIVSYLVLRLTRELEPSARETLIGTAIVIFVFRAVPTPGAGVEWWMIDELGFDPPFFSVLSLIASALTLLGMFVFRRFMAERSITYVVGFLTVCGTLLAVPFIAMFYGLHHWTARHRWSRRRPLHRARQHGARVAARPDRHDSDARLDRTLCPGAPQGDLFRGHGFVHQPRAVAGAARHQVSQPGVHRHARSQGPRQRRASGGRGLQRARAPPHHAGRARAGAAVRGNLRGTLVPIAYGLTGHGGRLSPALQRDA